MPSNPTKSKVDQQSATRVQRPPTSKLCQTSDHTFGLTASRLAKRRPPRHDLGSSSPVARLLVALIGRVVAIGTMVLVVAASATPPPSAGGGRKIAVVHVGPRKTGTTSIQSSTRIYKDAFRADGYLVVDHDPAAGLRIRNMTSGHLGRKPTQVIAFCSCGTSANWTADESNEQILPECDEGYHRRIRDALSDEANPIRDYNLIFSMEALDAPCVNIQAIRELLDGHWDVRVVVGYRRFFEWAASLYYEDNRVDDLAHRPERGVTWPTRDATTAAVNVRTWWTEERVLSAYHDRRYTTAVFRRYRDVFGDENVSILNVHEERGVSAMDGRGGLIEKFFCHQVLNATNACAALRAYDPERDRSPNPNRGGSTAYDEVAVAAYLSGLVGDRRGDGGEDEKDSGSEGDNTPVSRPALREWIRFRQEEMLNLTAADFPRDCMSDAILRLFLDLSLRAERSLVPSFFGGPHGERELRGAFKRAAESKLCAVDTHAVLRDPGWIAFFQSTSKGRPSSSPLPLISPPT